MIRIKHIAALLALALGFAVSPVKAQGYWDGVVVGKVIGVDGAQGNNYDFRVYLDVQNYCGTGTPNWAYLNADFLNYSALVSLVMFAWSTGKTVTMYSKKDVNGYCKIGYLVLR